MVKFASFNQVVVKATMQITNFLEKI